MAGTFTAKALGDGQVATSATAIYTVPSSTTAYIKSLTLFNTNAASQTILIYVNNAGSDRVVARFVLAQNERGVLTADDFGILQASDTVKATTTTASAVDYVLTGVEET